MKWKIILIGLLALAGFWSFFLVKKQPAPLPALDDQTYLVAPLENDVFLKNPGDSEFLKIISHQEIFLGSEIKTSATGRALLLYPNGSTTAIDKNSHLAISILDSKGNRSRLNLLFGGVLGRIQNVLGTDEFYEVQTQNSVATVRGTVLGVRFEEGKTLVLVLENRVEVIPIDPKTGQRIEEAALTVQEGEKTSINSAALPTAASPLRSETLQKNDLETDFIRENIDRETLEKPRVKEIFDRSKVPAPSVSPLPRFNDLVRKVLKETSQPTFTTRPLLTATPKPTETIKPIVTSTPTPIRTAPPTTVDKISPTPLPTAIPSTDTNQTDSPNSALPTPTPVLSRPVLESVVPSTITSLNKVDVIVNGRHLKGVRGVTINGIPVSFFALDELSIFASIPAGTAAGVYDIGVSLNSGEELKLPGALTIK